MQKSTGPVGSSLDLTPAESMILNKQQEKDPLRHHKDMSRWPCYADKEFPTSSLPSSTGELKHNIPMGGYLIGAIEYDENGEGDFPLDPLLPRGDFPENVAVSQSPQSPEFYADNHVSGSGALGGDIIDQPPGITQSGVIGGISLAPSNNYFSLQFFGSTAHCHDRLLAKAESIYSLSGEICGGNNQSHFHDHSNPVPIGPSNKSNGVAGTSLLCSVGSSSTLASMLGIELPTGLGSLRESSGNSSISLPDSCFNPSTNIGLLNYLSENSVKPSRMSPIIAPPSAHGNAIGRYEICGRNNDVTLLQTLLPGVKITSIVLLLGKLGH